MRRGRNSGTAPDLALRRAVHAAGLRYRVQHSVPGAGRRTLDIAFTRVRLAVLLNGCLWHACPEHTSFPRSNDEWWREKLVTNVARARDTEARLIGLGWTVLRLLEHVPVAEMADRATSIRAELAGRLGSARSEPEARR